VCRTIDNGRTVAFHIAASPHGSAHPVVEYREDKGRSHEETAANAALISSAPELYEALVTVEFGGGDLMNACPYCGRGEVSNHAPDCKLNNALRRARGESGSAG